MPNPARELERFAVAIVARWVGPRGSVTDTSAGHDPDFRIDYVDGRTGLGEVGWHQDPKLQAMWARTLKSDRHQQLSLPSGSGRWSVGLTLGANIRALKHGLPEILQLMKFRAVFHVDYVIDEWPRGDWADGLRALGVDHAYFHSWEEPSVAWFYMPSGGGTVGDDACVIADWFTSVLQDPEYPDTSRKLLEREADERHVFLMTGGRTPFAADYRLRQIADVPLPGRRPDVPSGITHVWGVCQFGSQSAALWSVAGGWQMVSLENLGIS